MPELDKAYLETVAASFRRRDLELAPGLTDREIAAVEQAHGFHFPPDLRRMLQYCLPVDDRFPDWRNPRSSFILGRLAWPCDGICYDIEHNVFWHTAWGKRPDTLDDALHKAREAVSAAPLLIPIYAHRYLPAHPCEVGNPVFSVYQTDIIYYGFDLPSYLFTEFDIENPFPKPDKPRGIRFWDGLVDA